MASKRQKLHGWISPSFDMDLAVMPGTSKNGAISRTKTLKESKLSPISSWTPKRKSDLAIHKKKLEELELWFKKQQQSDRRKAPVLLLSGPTGCGKTAALRVLASEFDYNIVEWINPMSSFDIQSAQEREFTHFLHGAQGCSVLIDGDLSMKGRKKMLLVKDFPNVFIRDPTMLAKVLYDYVTYARWPLVFIISDFTGGNATDNANLLQSRFLFPSHLIESLSIVHISFNPVANKILTDALKKLNGLPGGLSTQELGCLVSVAQGDIRNAVNSLQLLAESRKSNRRKNTSLDSIASRDSFVDVFQVLGRVLHNKRAEVESEDDLVALPAHLASKAKSRRINFCPAELVQKAGISAEHFVGFLHQNYPDFFKDDGNFECFSATSVYLSDAVQFENSWDLSTISSEHYAQEYMISVAVRGIMQELSPPAAPGSGSYRPFRRPTFSASKWRQVQTSAARTVTAFLPLFWSLESEGYFLDLIPFIGQMHRNCTFWRSFNAEQMACMDFLCAGLGRGRGIKRGNQWGKVDFQDGEDSLLLLDSCFGEEKGQQHSNVFSEPCTMTYDLSDSDACIEEFSD